MKCLALIVLGLFLTVTCFAQSAEKPSVAVPCAEERGRLCADAKAPDETILCLFKNSSSLSSVCKENLERFVEARRQDAQRGGGSLTGFGGPNAFGPPIPIIAYQGQLTPAQKGGPRLTEQRFDASAPFAKFGHETFAVSATAGQIDFGEPVPLDSGRTVASDLDRFEVGLQYRHQGADQTSWSVKAATGYAGDTASTYPRDASYSFTGTYGFLGSGTDYWVVLIFMSNNSTLANYIPIPGFIYIRKTDHFTGLFGFPVMALQWTPDLRWVYSASIFGVTAQAEVAYGAFARMQGFLGYAYTLESYIPALRDTDKDRVVVHEERVGPGFRAFLASQLQIELQSGYSFERFVTIESGLFKKDDGVAYLPAGWFSSLSVKYAF